MIDIKLFYWWSVLTQYIDKLIEYSTNTNIVGGKSGFVDELMFDMKNVF